MQKHPTYYEIELVKNSTDYSVPHLFSNDNQLFAIYEFKVPDLDHDGIFHDLLHEVRKVKSICVVYAFDGYQFEYFPAELNEEITGHARLFNFKQKEITESNWLNLMREELQTNRNQTLEETMSYRHFVIQYNSGILNVCARKCENDRIKGTISEYMSRHRKPLEHLEKYFE